MRGKRFCGWLIVILAVVLLTGGCAELFKGVLMEKQFDDGHTDRVKVDAGESWSAYDRNATKGDGTCVMLRKETTF
jgi:hypothetical protein